MMQAPMPAEQRESQALADMVRAEIRSCGGWISFEQFMQLVLYTPELGYYAGYRQIFGAGGDYVTAPTLGGLFVACLARQIAEILHDLGLSRQSPAQSPIIVEFGAGNGDLAAMLLTELDKLNALPVRYSILETGAALQARQQARVADLPDRIANRVHWLQSLPSQVHGVMLANEVLDAMPFHRFQVVGDGDVVALGVRIQGDTFCWAPGEAPAELVALVQTQELPDGYQSEWSRQVPAWVASAADSLQHGVLLMVDYGYERQRYYHPDRAMGTMRCHYRHLAHDDPFLWPGLQDITAHVDFSGVFEAAQTTGLVLLGYTEQVQFLINSGFAEIYAQRLRTLDLDSPPALALNAEARRLTLPYEMGEQFKCIAFGRHYEALSAFAHGDQSRRLMT